MNHNLTKTTETSVATINNQNILVFEENDTKYVAVKPISEALGMNYSTQVEKIKSHPILGSVISLRGSTGVDEKQYEMLTLPLKYVFGWLFTINPNNVKEESRSDLIKYQKECYNTLYREFYEKAEFYSQKDKEKYRLEAELQVAKLKVSLIKGQVKTVEEVTFEEWVNDRTQLKLNFDAQVEKEVSHV